MPGDIARVPRGGRTYDHEAGARGRRRHRFRLKILAPPYALIDETTRRIIFKMKNSLRPDHIRGKLTQRGRQPVPIERNVPAACPTRERGCVPFHGALET